MRLIFANKRFMLATYQLYIFEMKIGVVKFYWLLVYCLDTWQHIGCMFLPHYTSLVAFPFLRPFSPSFTPSHFHSLSFTLCLLLISSCLLPLNPLEAIYTRVSQSARNEKTVTKLVSRSNYSFAHSHLIYNRLRWSC